MMGAWRVFFSPKGSLRWTLIIPETCILHYAGLVSFICGCRQDLSSATAAIEELFGKINDIRRKAEQSEVMVQEICRDIRKLDYAKQHLTQSITALRRFAMLCNAVGEAPQQPISMLPSQRHSVTPFLGALQRESVYSAAVLATLCPAPDWNVLKLQIQRWWTPFFPLAQFVKRRAHQGFMPGATHVLSFYVSYY